MSDDCPHCGGPMNDNTGLSAVEIYVAEAARLRNVLADALRENERLRAGLRIIAGLDQCADNLMGNADVARTALAETESKP